MKKFALSLLLALCFNAHAAQFWTDFNSYPTGDIATASSGAFTVQDTPGGDWTNNVVDLGGGDHALRVTRTVTAQDLTLITYDAFEGTGDFEVVVKITLGTTSDQNSPVGPALIAADGRAYAWRATAAATSTLWRLSLFSATGTVNASIGSDVSFTEPSAGTPLWMLISRNGGNICGSLWISDGGRPGSPMSCASNTTLTTVKPGVITLDASDIPFTFAIFGAGSNGSAAPETEPPPPGSGNLLLRRRRGP